MTVKVVLADDQALMRAGFKVLIDAEPDLEVVGEAGDGGTAVKVARDARADVILMDIRMPGLDGIAATRLIAADRTLAHVKVLILTTFEQDAYVFHALEAGASGFLGKNVDPADLIAAIRVVDAGEALLSPFATKALIGAHLSRPTAQSAVTAGPDLGDLTEREAEVVGLVAEGLSNAEIAARLFISPLTAKTHVSRAMTKLAARDRAQLVVEAFRRGIAVVDRRGGLP
ncbi:response regulator transcription factor [Demequina soli]|uniref:response regulator transcription factor n=1 Tax=Demequina soli TaxID=1638987 RepID=UPI00078561CC|nr:response regulator transcription factor [Demequina soli]